MDTLLAILITGSEVFFYEKIRKEISSVAGVIAMLMIILVYGFAETRIPGIVYLAMWCVCAAAICYGTDTQLAI